MGDYVFPFEKLEVWQLAVDLADYVLGLLEAFPPNKHIRLVGQMEAAVVSSSQNIAEGKGRFHRKEYIQFLYYARGSIFETVTLLFLFEKRVWFSSEQRQSLYQEALIITKMLNKLIGSMK